MITAQEHIFRELEELRASSKRRPFNIPEDIAGEISKIIFNKKYRKYSANDELREHAKNALAQNIKDQKPINVTFLHGAYKLWRLEESPEADWAEFFSLMYYTHWLRNICDIYKPGVHLDFFVDDYIVPELGTDTLENVQKYIASYQKLISFLEEYRPANFKITITPVGSLFPSQEAFKKALSGSMAALDKEHPDGPPPIDEKRAHTIELNTQNTKGQLKDPLWREKIACIETAYMTVKRGANYHYKEDKILAFTQPLPSGTTISVGTTKRSIMKFWIGAGVLVKKDDHFSADILSPRQLEEISAVWEKISIPDLMGKNFKQIRIVDEFR